jgi:hypothetical protein
MSKKRSVRMPARMLRAVSKPQSHFTAFVRHSQTLGTIATLFRHREGSSADRVARFVERAAPAFGSEYWMIMRCRSEIAALTFLATIDMAAVPGGVSAMH